MMLFTSWCLMMKLCRINLISYSSISLRVSLHDFIVQVTELTGLDEEPTTNDLDFILTFFIYHTYAVLWCCEFTYYTLFSLLTVLQQFCRWWLWVLMMIIMMVMVTCVAGATLISLLIYDKINEIPCSIRWVGCFMCKLSGKDYVSTLWIVFAVSCTDYQIFSPAQQIDSLTDRAP